MFTLSKRAEEIPPFLVMDILERANELEREGHRIVHLEIGEPDFPTPQSICRGAMDAMERGLTHYTHSQGIWELRECICRYYNKRYGVDISPDQIIVTPGTSPGLFMVFSALLDPGDQLIMTDPHYPCYPNFVRFLGAEPVFINVHEDDGFQMDPDIISSKINPKVKGILINSPSNPTGTLLSDERMAEIANLGPLIISDEIYHGLVYEGKERSILEFTDRAIVLNGFSKAFAMTGWRLGYIICPKELVRPIQKIQQNLIISAPSISQWGAIRAFDEAIRDMEHMRNVFDERRRYMIRGLKEMGFRIPVEPVGAFYVFVNARELSEDSLSLAFDILEKAHVGVSPGIQFGKNAEGFLRFSYANSLENIQEGLRRLKEYINSLKQ